MQAVLGNAVSVAVQHRVGLRRSVSGNEMERFGCFQLRVDLGEQIQQARIDFVDLPIPVIPEQMVDLDQRIRDVPAIGPINNLQFLALVCRL